VHASNGYDTIRQASGLPSRILTNLRFFVADGAHFLAPELQRAAKAMARQLRTGVTIRVTRPSMGNERAERM
jgi:hypothetical protein